MNNGGIAKSLELRPTAILPRSQVAQCAPQSALPQRIRKGIYPDFRMEATSVNPDLVSTVMSVLKKLHYRDLGMDTTMLNVFTKMKSKGLTEAYRYYLQHVLFCRPPYTARLLDEATDVFDVQAGDFFGQYVMDQMTPEQTRTFFPYCDFEFHPHDDMHSIEVTFTALESFPMHSEDAYFSPARPRIQIDNNSRVVAFRRHAMDRIRERIYAGQLDYRRTGSFHQRIQRDCLFEPRKLYNGQHAFAFWTRARTGIIYRGSNGFRFLRELLPGIDSRKTYWYLLGYCPVTLWHGFAIAQTLLYPGFQNTPEYGLIINSDLSFSAKRQMLDRVQAWEEQRSEAQTDMELVSWFHGHGSPQVVETGSMVDSYPQRS